MAKEKEKKKATTARRDKLWNDWKTVSCDDAEWKAFWDQMAWQPKMEEVGVGVGETKTKQSMKFNGKICFYPVARLFFFIFIVFYFCGPILSVVGLEGYGDGEMARWRLV